MKLTDELEKLGESEVRKRLANKVYGSDRNPNYLSVQEWLRGKECESRETRDEESLSISRKALQASEEANNLAFRANSIALKARSDARWANILATIATITAAIAIIVPWLTKN